MVLRSGGPDTLTQWPVPRLRYAVIGPIRATVSRMDDFESRLRRLEREQRWQWVGWLAALFGALLAFAFVMRL